MERQAAHKHIDMAVMQKDKHTDYKVFLDTSLKWMACTLLHILIQTWNYLAWEIQRQVSLQSEF